MARRARKNQNLTPVIVIGGLAVLGLTMWTMRRRTAGKVLAPRVPGALPEGTVPMEYTAATGITTKLAIPQSLVDLRLSEGWKIIGG